MHSTTKGPWRSRVVTSLLVAGLVAGCGFPGRKDPVPETHSASAVLLGLQNVRYFLREDLERLVSDVRAAARSQGTSRSRSLPATTNSPTTMYP